MKNSIIKVVMLATLVAGVSLVAANWPRVKAIQDSEDRPNPFGFIELIPGQTARLNVVVNTEGFRTQPPPRPDTQHTVRLAFDVFVEDEENTPGCGGIVPAPPTCLVRYRFLRRESREVDLMSREAASLAFTAVERTRIAALIQSIGDPDILPTDQFTPEPHLAPSLEVREGTRTLFVVPAVVRGFNPQPDPPHQR